MGQQYLPAARSDFIGIENIIHLATGGEPPLLARHSDAFENFAHDVSEGLLQTPCHGKGGHARIYRRMGFRHPDP